MCDSCTDVHTHTNKHEYKKHVYTYIYIYSYCHFNYGNDKKNERFYNNNQFSSYNIHLYRNNLLRVTYKCLIYFVHSSKLLYILQSLMKIFTNLSTLT